jgi:ubiquitin-protein ligase E3 A
MGLTFTADYESWGTTVSTELKVGGKNIEVTNENKEEYVDLLIDFLMNKSIEKMFKSFEKGFNKCCGGEVLSMIEPEDLEMLICGSKILDFNELKKSTVYQDGYNAESETVKRFWEVILEFTEDEKKKFLFFCTGCDRAPINGLGDLKFYISKHGNNDELLPSVHTCFNHFLLPDYSTKDILREKLLKAIHNSEGFGLI